MNYLETIFYAPIISSMRTNTMKEVCTWFDFKTFTMYMMGRPKEPTETNLNWADLLYIVLHYSAENPNWHTESDGRWFTSRVISRIKSNLVQTKGGPYCLEGKMNFQLAFSYGTPQFILSAFKSGFPENWDMYREQWRKFTKQQRGMIIFIVNC